MLKQVKTEKVPFHKWFFWIDKRVQLEARAQRKENAKIKAKLQAEAAIKMQEAAAADGQSSSIEKGQRKGIMGRFKNMFSGKGGTQAQESSEGKNVSVSSSTAKSGNENLKSPGEEVKIQVPPMPAGSDLSSQFNHPYGAKGP